MDDDTAARVVRDVLVDVASRAETITYEQLLARAGDEVRALLRSDMARVLRRISIEDDDAGRGLLTALVVRGDTGRPGKGWFELAGERGRSAATTDPERTWADEVAHVHRAARDA